MLRINKLLSAGAVAAALAFVPLTVSVQEGDSSAGGNLLPAVRLAEACSQATSCKRRADYLCSTHNGNEEGWECATGCEPIKPS
jgi:hypothetical protein